jgi:hypothetical protein
MRDWRLGTTLDDTTLKNRFGIQNMKANVHVEPVNVGDNLVQCLEGVHLSRLVAYFLRIALLGLVGPLP